MAEDNREHWPTMGVGFVRDQLARYGVSDEKAKALGRHGAARLLHELEAKNDRHTNCDIDALVAEMRRHGVELVEAKGDWKLQAKSVAARKWVDELLPTLRLRKDEIVAAWGQPPEPEVRHCRKCLAQVYDPGYDGVGCEFILSCPFIPEENRG